MDNREIVTLAWYPILTLKYASKRFVEMCYLTAFVTPFVSVNYFEMEHKTFRRRNPIPGN